MVQYFVCRIYSEQMCNIFLLAVCCKSPWQDIVTTVPGHVSSHCRQHRDILCCYEECLLYFPQNSQVCTDLCYGLHHSASPCSVMLLLTYMDLVMFLFFKPKTAMVLVSLRYSDCQL